MVLPPSNIPSELLESWGPFDTARSSPNWYLPLTTQIQADPSLGPTETKEMPHRHQLPTSYRSEYQAI